MTSLSEMPEDILFRISSSLTNKEVAHVSILSKAYRDLMRRRPTLVCDFMKMPNLEDLDQMSMLGRYRGEVRSIQSSLVRYNEENIDLETFIFRADLRNCHRLQTSSPEDYNLYDNCIALAMQKVVRNIDLSMWPDYVLHVPAVMESPEQFSASYCRLQIEGPVLRWPNLKRLCLLHVLLGCEAVFDNIVRGCPLLEDLELDFFECEGEVANLKFKVVNLRNLKKVKAKLGPTQSLEVIGAPNLESVACLFRFSLESWEDPRNYRLDWIWQPAQYTNLTKLSLENVRLDDDYFLHLAQMFPKLEHLSIKHIQLQRIKVSSQTVKVLHLAFISKLEEAQFDVPSIAVFKFRFRYLKVMPKLSFTRTSKRWISRLRIRCFVDINTWWFEELKDFILTAVNGSQIFLSTDFLGSVTFDGANVIKHSKAFHGIQEIEEFYANCVLSGKLSSTSFHQVLENIFWFCRPKTVLLRNWGKYNFDQPWLLHEFLLPAAGTSDGWTRLSDPPRNCVCAWRVTGIKVFRHVKANSMEFYDCKVGRGLELLPGASDSKAFLELLVVHEQNKMFICGFDLDWRICDMHI